MKKIEEQRQWYKLHSNSPYDAIVGLELDKIIGLYCMYEDHTNEMFVNEMIESFCKIIEKQREKIDAIEARSANGFASQPLGHSYVAAQSAYRDNKPAPAPEAEYMLQEGFQDDEQLQQAFTQYCLSNGVSSYTVNDYCSRIRKTWRTFEDEHRRGKLKEELAVQYPDILWDGILLNAYDCIEVMGLYILEKIAVTDSNRNWLNARAALNKLYEFKKCMEQYRRNGV